MHKYMIYYYYNFQTAVRTPYLRPYSPRNISVPSGLQIAFLSYLLIKLLSLYIAASISDPSRLLTWTFAVPAKDNVNRQKEMGGRCSHWEGQRCMGILVAFHKESLDWKDRGEKRKQKELLLKRTNPAISYCIVLYIHYVVWYNYINDTFTKSGNCMFLSIHGVFKKSSLSSIYKQLIWEDICSSKVVLHGFSIFAKNLI